MINDCISGYSVIVARVLRENLARVQISVARHMKSQLIIFDFFGTLGFFAKEVKKEDFLKGNVDCGLFDDAKEVFGLPCQKAILTTGSAFLFSNLGLEKHFEIFTPKETKFIKPDTRAFLMVLEKFNVKPKQAVMVGDEIERDILPAEKLGMKAILIDRENKIKNYSGIKIRSLAELKNILI